MGLLTKDFDFHLPEDRIAQHPAQPRDKARLLDGRNLHHIDDKHVFDLPRMLKAGDLLIVNDTDVIPAQLFGYCGQARIGITLDQPQDKGTWRVLIKNIKRLKIGCIIHFEHRNQYATVIDIYDGGCALLRFSCQGRDFEDFLNHYAALALPPYIHRLHGPTKEDQKDYKTVFAHHKGAVAAPTAGLHFTKDLLHALSQQHIEIDTVTLHVGAGTFLPVREENVTQHHIHSEYGVISEKTAHHINKTRQNGGRIIAVGTTSLRILESAADKDGYIHPFKGNTSIFIIPGYQFKAVDLLLTNFHLPRSTLFMLVCAFSGTSWMKRLYHHAVEHHYRFYSYGDACLLQQH